MPELPDITVYLDCLHPRGVGQPETRTPKRTLTDPRSFSGIGNVYCDEVIHRAQLSRLTWTWGLADAEVGRLFDAVCATLRAWTERLRLEAGAGFPEKVPA